MAIRKANKVVKYSELRKKFKFDEGKTFHLGLASCTHWLQNLNGNQAHHFQQEAKNYLIDRYKELGIAEEPSVQHYLKLEWDVPFPPPKQPKFTFIDLFAGIGGFRLAFQAQGGKCVFTSEWDRNSQRTYEANFGEVPFGDITKIQEANIPEHDILLGGFPCQPFSIAGVSKKNSLGRKHGFADETQGTLFYDIVRILKHRKPRAFLLENVKNLKSHDKGRTYKIISEALKELGYLVFDKIVDAKHYVPQHRERIFIAGFDRRVFGDSLIFKFPEQPNEDRQVKEILEKKVDPRYTLTDKLWQYLQDYARKHQQKGNGFGFGLIDPAGITRTLSARYYKDGSEILIPQGKGKNPRRLTPKECRALMGYPEEFRIDNIGVSDTQLYRQFGNSVAVPVVIAIAHEMILTLKRHEQHLNKKIRVGNREPELV